MKKSDKDKYIKSFGEDSLVGLKQEYFDALKLSETYYRNYADELFEAEFEKAFGKHKLTLVIVEEQLIEEIKIAIKEEFYSLFNFSLNTYEFSEMQSITGTDDLSCFINSISKIDIERIKRNIEKLIVPMSLSMINLFTILNDNNDAATILQENAQLKKQLDNIKNSPNFKYHQEIINEFWDANNKSTYKNQGMIVREVIMKNHPGLVKSIAGFLKQANDRRDYDREHSDSEHLPGDKSLH